MGECGCGEISNYESRKVGDYVLVIEKYMGCRYCHTGLMVSVHLFTREEADAFQFDYSKEFKPDEYGHAELTVIFDGTEITNDKEIYIGRIGSRR